MKKCFVALVLLVMFLLIPKVKANDDVSPWTLSMSAGVSGSTLSDQNSRFNTSLDLDYNYNDDLSFFINGSYNPLQTEGNENDYYCITALGGFRYMITTDIFTEFGLTMNEFENSSNINAGMSVGIGGYTNISSNVIIGARATYNSIFLNNNTNNLYSGGIFAGYNF